jgi:hypothetical protein
MEKNKREKKKNKGLRSLILLLFLTIIMFGTSTYAWFTANRVVTINSLDVHVEASNGIQISTNATAWKSVITNPDIKTGAYSGNVNQVPQEVTAVSTDGVPTAAGRLNMYSSFIDNDSTTGDYNIKTILETDTQGTEGKYIAFDIFLRVDSDQTIYLTSDSDVTKIGNEERGLKNAARVAFVNLGHAASTAAASTITALNTGASSSVIMWEPNSDAHTDVVVTSVAPDYSVTLTETSTGSGLYNPVAYRGIKYAIDPALDLRGVVNGTVTTDASSNQISAAVTPTIRTLQNNAVYTQFATLQAGVTKFRVYMWIEGQDIDCENNATGSDISYKIQLSTQSSANPAASSASSSNG